MAIERDIKHMGKHLRETVEKWVAKVTREMIKDRTVLFTKDIPKDSGLTLRKVSLTKKRLPAPSREETKILRKKKTRATPKSIQTKIFRKVDKIKKINVRRKKAATYYLNLGSYYGELAWNRAKQERLGTTINRNFKKPFRKRGR